MNRKRHLFRVSLVFALCFAVQRTVFPANPDNQEYVVLILAPEKLKTGDELPEQMKNVLRTSRDLRADLKYLESDVYTKGKGKDKAARIKNFIYEHEKKFGTAYVILLGDCDIFPVRYVPLATKLKKQRILSHIYARLSYMALSASGASWGDSDCGGHLDWAQNQENNVLLDQIKNRMDMVFNKMEDKKWDRAALFANISIFMNSLGIDFGTDLRNSRDWIQLVNWAFAAPCATLVQETEIKLEMLFAEVDASAIDPVVWMYTIDSVFLTSLGIPFDSKNRNDQNPASHFNWANARAKKKAYQSIADEFAEKCIDLMKKSLDPPLTFAQIAHHQRLYGFWLGADSETCNGNTLEEHAAWAKGRPFDMLAANIRLRIMRIYIHLLNDFFWIASDLYYSCIQKDDGSFDSWDENGNGVYGEIEIQPGPKPGASDGADLVPDLCVSRIPVSNAMELSFYLEKMKSRDTCKQKSDHFSRIGLFDTTATFINSDDYDYLLDATKITIQNPNPGTPDPDWARGIPFFYHVLNKQDFGVAVVSVHGMPNQFASILTVRNPAGFIDPDLANQNMLPVLYSAACLTGRFAPIPHDYSFPNSKVDSGYLTTDGEAYRFSDSASVAYSLPQPNVLQEGYDVESLAEHLTVKGKSGVIAFGGSQLATNLGPMIPYLQSFMRVYNTFAVRKRFVSTGQLFMEAQKRFISDYDVSHQTGTYVKALLMMNFFGDPTDVLYIPSYRSYPHGKRTALMQALQLCAKIEQALSPEASAKLEAAVQSFTDQLSVRQKKPSKDWARKEVLRNFSDLPGKAADLLTFDFIVRCINAASAESDRLSMNISLADQDAASIATSQKLISQMMEEFAQVTETMTNTTKSALESEKRVSRVLSRIR